MSDSSPRAAYIPTQAAAENFINEQSQTEVITESKYLLNFMS